jgi:hypothetical protein
LIFSSRGSRAIGDAVISTEVGTVINHGLSHQADDPMHDKIKVRKDYVQEVEIEAKSIE